LPVYASKSIPDNNRGYSDLFAEQRISHHHAQKSTFYNPHIENNSGSSLDSSLFVKQNLIRFRFSKNIAIPFS
jgi:hypothetical protein